MKKALALLLPLAMIASYVSCSQNSKQSEPAPSTGASASDGSDPSAGTNYTKGTLKDGYYTNEFAKLKLQLPSDVLPEPEAQLEWQKENAISSAADEKAAAREKAKIWDCVLGSDYEYIAISFINTKEGFPDTPDLTAEGLLDIYKDTVKQAISTNNTEAEWSERTTVKLGSEEFTRDTIAYKPSSNHEYLYARRIDDDFICFIDIAVIDEKKTTDYYEKMFS